MELETAEAQEFMTELANQVAGFADYDRTISLLIEWGILSADAGLKTQEIWDGGRSMSDSITWSELAELTHATQVARFNFCTCEDNEGNPNPYDDCPNAETICGDCLIPLNQCQHAKEYKR